MDAWCADIARRSCEGGVGDDLSELAEVLQHPSLLDVVCAGSADGLAYGSPLEPTLEPTDEAPGSAGGSPIREHSDACSDGAPGDEHEQLDASDMLSCMMAL